MSQSLTFPHPSLRAGPWTPCRVASRDRVGRGQPMPRSCILSLPGDTAELKDLLRQAGAAGVPSSPAEQAQPEGNAHRQLPPPTP